ncbi:MAG: pyridoxamine 5'-phosphate oxidase family protein [Treponema sp.]|nr:pyridoxamine 5'-phosphate oxidase family protein [Treponema sp.]
MKIEDIAGIIEKSDGAVFSTVNEKGYPESRALLNLANKKQYPELIGKALITDGNRVSVYFTTNTSSRKVSQLRTNPKSSLYFCIPDKFLGAGLCGIMTEITDQKIKDDFWQPGWRIYYHRGSSDPDYALLKFVSEDIRSWYHSAEHTFSVSSAENTKA